MLAPAEADLTRDRIDGIPGGVGAFQAVRPRLFGIAYQVLGSAPDADDIVQDTWIRWQGTDQSEVRDAAAFLVTTATRLAINLTQSARVRRECSVEPRLADPIATEADPCRRVERNDALEVAVLTLLEKLPPTERAVYVLREAFDYPYRQIAAILLLSEPNARQIMTRARHHLRCDRRRPVADYEQRRFLAAFAGAAQTGDLTALERLLTEDATRSDLRA